MRIQRSSALAAVVVMGALLAPAGASAHTTTPTNIIKDSGAEAAQPTTSGTKVRVPSWTVGKHSQFTAIGYGAPAFPTAHSPGPKHRGVKFFGGGPSGSASSGYQLDSLQSYRTMIKAGNARFTVSGWFGGYSSQGDYATLTVVWKNASKATVGTATKIGAVTAAQRHNKSGLLFCKHSGIVPQAAAYARVTLRMVRKEGEYIDGYADLLRLTIVHK